MRLRELREDRDIKQKELAKLLHVNQNTYSQYETGLHQIPLGSLIKLAYFYDTSIDYIVGITDDTAPYSRRWPKEHILSDK